jgi:hypothetical protein
MGVRDLSGDREGLSPPGHGARGMNRPRIQAKPMGSFPPSRHIAEGTRLKAKLEVSWTGGG